MSTVTYIAKSKITSAHTLDQTYTINIECLSRVFSQKQNNKKHTSLSGRTQTIYHSADEFYSIRTAAMGKLERDLMWEFFASVRGGVVFGFDETGYIASPDSTINAQLEGEPSESYTNGMYSFSFKLRAYI